MEMRKICIGWIGMFWLCFSFFSVALAGDSVQAPGVQINSDGSVVAPGVKVSADGDVSTSNVEASDDGTFAVSKGPGGSYFIRKDSQTFNLKCNGETIAVEGDNNIINCQGNSPLLSITGEGNTIHFKGACDQLAIVGDENKAEMKRINSIQTTGDGNQITWVSASSGPKPKIATVGENNVIKKAK